VSTKTNTLITGAQLSMNGEVAPPPCRWRGSTQHNAHGRTVACRSKIWRNVSCLGRKKLACSETPYRVQVGSFGFGSGFGRATFAQKSG
jgi:hypothetical protein